jgi:hypothetical protein
MTSDTPATTKASASRDTENLRGVEPVDSVDRFSNSEGAEGSDISTLSAYRIWNRWYTTFGTSELEALWMLKNFADVGRHCSAIAIGDVRRGIENIELPHGGKPLGLVRRYWE